MEFKIKLIWELHGNYLVIYNLYNLDYNEFDNEYYSGYNKQKKKKFLKKIYSVKNKEINIISNFSYFF